MRALSLYPVPEDSGDEESARERSVSKRSVPERSVSEPLLSDHQLDERQPDEPQLVARIHDGDERAFDTLYRMHYQGLATFAARYTSSWERAEEVVQDVFVKLWTQRTTLSTIVSIRAYLYGAVRNGALNTRKHEARVMRIHTAALGSGAILGVAGAPTRPDVAVEQADMHERLREEIAQLPERQHAALVLRYEHGLSFNDVAQALGVSDVAASKLVRKAEDRLRRVFTRRNF